MKSGGWKGGSGEWRVGGGGRGGEGGGFLLFFPAKDIPCAVAKHSVFPDRHNLARIAKLACSGLMHSLQRDMI